jgi:serine kinase of HPr protein (carbohydrate metabolism regulator)
MAMDVVHLHASCVAIGSSGVLLMGESGTGKSDMALRLIDRGAILVADDRVEITRKGKSVVVNAPKSIEGLLEIHGVGIFKMKSRKNTPLRFVALLASHEWIERLPYPEPYSCLGMEIPQMRLCPFELSSVIKVEMAVGALQDGTMTVGALKE